MTYFIKFYNSYPCLLEDQSGDYKDRNKKNTAGYILSILKVVLLADQFFITF